MTPSATTPAGRKAMGDHRPKLRSQPGPKLPRRVSGPLRPKRAGERRTPSANRPHLHLSLTPLARRAIRERAAGFLRSLPDHRLIDRLVRGRAWIPVLGVMLAGIVAMQVEVLKLGASIGRSIQTSSALMTRNEQLRASVASLADDQRIERLAASMGMIMPAPASVAFLSARPDGAAARAVANIHAPDATTFLASQTSNGTVATTSTLSPANGSITATPDPGAPGSTASTGTTAAPAQTVSTGTTAAPTQTAQPTQTTQSAAAPVQTTTTQTTSTQSGASSGG